MGRIEMKIETEIGVTNEKKLRIFVGSGFGTSLAAIDSRIEHDGQWLKSIPAQADCTIPISAAGVIINKLIQSEDIVWVVFSGMELNEDSIKSITFQKFSSLQEDYLLGEFDINSADSQGNTLLHWAAACLDIKMIQFLLESGAKDNIENNNNETPYTYAKNHIMKSSEIQEVFTQWSTIKADIKSDRVNTVLMFQKLTQDDSNSLPHIPNEIVRIIGESQTPSFHN